MRPTVQTDSKHRMVIIHNFGNFQISSDKYIDIYDYDYDCDCDCDCDYDYDYDYDYDLWSAWLSEKT